MNYWLKSKAKKEPKNEESQWISVSDLMSGLMLIFLFISLSLMQSAIEERDKVKKKLEKTGEITNIYQITRAEIDKKLQVEFGNDLVKWDAAIDSKTLSFLFNSPEVLFERGQDNLQPKFMAILDDFFPRYLKILLQHQESITEVRIEGHTSSEWGPGTPPEVAYFNNMALSQDRTRSVLEYVYARAPSQDAAWVKKQIAAVGYSSSKPILTRDMDKREDMDKSRRVVFRVITNSEEKIEEVIRSLLEADSNK